MGSGDHSARVLPESGKPSIPPLAVPYALGPRMGHLDVATATACSSPLITSSKLRWNARSQVTADVERYFQLTNLESRDRVALFRLAHDVAVSGFGNRQVLYERFFFGPQNVMASIYYDLYDKDEMMDRVTALLG